MDSRDVGVIWCPDSRYNHGIGWGIPRQVERVMRELAGDGSVLHLFGGRARWGIRLDIDPVVRPDVIGDAYLAPFARDTFDTVVLDPPYAHVDGHSKVVLFRQAGWIARARVLWFHTHWVPAAAPLHLERAWLVRTGRSSATRCLLAFTVNPEKQRPAPTFKRGPQRRYNRWLAPQERLDFGARAL